MEHIWVSENGQWAVHSVKEELDLTVALVLDLTKFYGGRSFGVEINHSKLVEEPYDNFECDRPMPNFVKDKLLELSTITRNDG